MPREYEQSGKFSVENCLRFVIGTPSAYEAINVSVAKYSIEKSDTTWVTHHPSIFEKPFIILRRVGSIFND
jgi:hypothetical protein